MAVKNLRTIIVIVAVIIIGAIVWYWRVYRPKTEQPGASNISNAPAAAPSSTLGGTLYEKANNPVQNKLPATVAPVPNPLENVYKNPFR